VSDLYTKRQFMDKCAWEGGGLNEGFHYGIGSNHLDDGDPEFKAMVSEAEEHWDKFHEAERAIVEKFGYFDDQDDDYDSDHEDGDDK
jgi:hypothetical protein